jgi:regulator of replication initiation timing
MNIITELNPIINSLNESDKLDTIRKILEVQQRINDLIDENQWLKKEKDKLYRKLEVWNLLKFEDDAYWLKDMKDGLQGPYCPKCYGIEGKLVPLVKNGEQCPNCGYTRRKIRL